MEHTNPTPTPPTTHEPEPAGRPATGRITRPRDRRVIAGVGSAIADRLDIDVGLVRLGLAVSVFFGGFGIFAYLMAWGLIPSEGEERAAFERWFGSPTPKRAPQNDAG